MTDNAQIPNEAVPANNAAQPEIAEAPQAVQPAVATAPVVPTDNTRTQQQFEKLLESNKGLYEAN